MCNSEKGSLPEQGVDAQKVAQAVWNEACQEQDRRGIRIHKTLLQCDAAPSRPSPGTPECKRPPRPCSPHRPQQTSPCILDESQ
ncbi:MAG TPA: hypothetical protein VK140_16090 [Ktedonobacteraceae bacterium]|nr:hypothetical protein [Ktedonobacteraceae bacterium]